MESTIGRAVLHYIKGAIGIAIVAAAILWVLTPNEGIFFLANMILIPLALIMELFYTVDKMIEWRLEQRESTDA